MTNFFFFSLLCLGTKIKSVQKSALLCNRISFWIQMVRGVSEDSENACRTVLSLLIWTLSSECNTNTWQAQPAENKLWPWQETRPLLQIISHLTNCGKQFIIVNINYNICQVCVCVLCRLMSVLCCLIVYKMKKAPHRIDWTFSLLITSVNFRSYILPVKLFVSIF